MGSIAPIIAQDAQQYNVDWRAAIAVAEMEGGLQTPAPGTLQHAGDWYGGRPTSFGPFQLHEGGRLPSRFAGHPQDAQAWAWSPTGIEYALRGIGGTSAGLRGQAAVSDIVRDFEAPADPSAEIRGAMQHYPHAERHVREAGGKAPDKGGGGIGGFIGDVIHAPSGIDIAKGAAGGIGDAWGSITNFFQFLFSFRFLELLGGGVLFLLGLILLGRQLLSDSGAEQIIPVMRAAKAVR